jgi:hypothetical protein
MDTLLRERQCAVEHIENYIRRELELPRVILGAAIILPLGHDLIAGAMGSIKPLAQFLLSCRLGLETTEESSACAITACTMLSPGLPRLATN